MDNTPPPTCPATYDSELTLVLTYIHFCGMTHAEKLLNYWGKSDFFFGLLNNLPE